MYLLNVYYNVTRQGGGGDSLNLSLKRVRKTIPEITVCAVPLVSLFKNALLSLFYLWAYYLTMDQGQNSTLVK